MSGAASSLVRGSRARAGLSLRDLAARAGLPVSTIHRIEQGRMNPSIGVLEQIAEAFGATIQLDLRPDPQLGLAGWAAAATANPDTRARVRLAAELASMIAAASGARARELLSVEPIRFGDDRWDGFSAALASHLALSARVAPPAWLATWTMRPAEPWWVVDVHAVRAIVCATTPLPFKLRGIYIDRGALVNV